MSIIYMIEFKPESISLKNIFPWYSRLIVVGLRHDGYATRSIQYTQLCERSIRNKR